MPRKQKWFRVTKHKTGWSKDLPQTLRRSRMLRAHKGDYLASGRALVALANVTKDRETELKARKDASHFFAIHKHRKQR